MTAHEFSGGHSLINLTRAADIETDAPGINSRSESLLVGNSPEGFWSTAITALIITSMIVTYCLMGRRKKRIKGDGRLKEPTGST